MTPKIIPDITGNLASLLFSETMAGSYHPPASFRSEQVLGPFLPMCIFMICLCIFSHEAHFWTWPDFVIPTAVMFRGLRGHWVTMALEVGSDTSSVLSPHALTGDQQWSEPLSLALACVNWTSAPPSLALSVRGVCPDAWAHGSWRR